jgi:hypothetical protein
MLKRHGANYGHHRSEMTRNNDGSLPIGATANTKKQDAFVDRE